MWATPLDPPPGMIVLEDPLVQLFGGASRPLTRDLFFSGHTSTMFLLFLAVPGAGGQGLLPGLHRQRGLPGPGPARPLRGGRARRPGLRLCRVADRPEGMAVGGGHPDVKFPRGPRRARVRWLRMPEEAPASPGRVLESASSSSTTNGWSAGLCSGSSSGTVTR